MESFHSIAIVGAGLSGLYAAQLLKDQFPDLVVLESQNRIGGRIKQIHGIAPWPVEAGPAFVHGRNSVFVRMAEKELGVVFGEKEWPEWWYFNEKMGGQGLIHDDDVDDEVDKVHDLMTTCGESQHPPPGADQSAAEWLAARGCSARQLAVADACYANDFACSLRQLGVREMVEENKHWDDGETYLLMDRPMSSVITHLARGVNNIRTNWVVDSITYAANSDSNSSSSSSDQTSAGVTVRAKDGRVVRCRAVLVTVPISVLQRGCIRFEPPLPQPKVAAIGRVRMGNAIKLVMQFSRRFWRDDMYDVVCPGEFVPEFWMLDHPITDPTAGPPNVMIGFLAGENADGASALGSETSQRLFLEQLDKIYGSESDPRPASSSLVRGQMVDWSKEQYVYGAYTYPSFGAELGDRSLIAAPLASRLFFAGEATNEAINPCMQGAMQTAERAAAQIKAALSAAPRSKL